MASKESQTGQFEIIIRDSSGTILTMLDEQLKKWRNYFKTLLNRPPPVNPLVVQATRPLNINTGPITKHEIKTALKNLKNGIATGTDNIPPEALKAGDQTSMDTLHNLINHIWDAPLKSTVDKVLGEKQAGFLRERSCTDN